MHVTKYFQKRHQIAKVELISKEILKRNLAKKGLQAQLETCHSPDDAVSSVKHQTIGLPPRGFCRKVWSYRKKILTNQGVLAWRYPAMPYFFCCCRVLPSHI